MAYTLEEFSADCRAALQAEPGPAGRQKVREYVSKACLDEDFKAQYLSDDNAPDRKVLYEDPDLGFCICAHFYEGAKDSNPHDHGESWAIYGQAVGQTVMTDWKCVEPPTESNPGLVEKVTDYPLNPGDAHVYNEGDLHSPSRADTTRLIRIEGKDLTTVKRRPFKVASTAA